MLAGSAPAEEAPAPDVERPVPIDASRWDDTGRFYLLAQSGFALLADDSFAGDTHFQSHEFPASNDVNVPIGLSVGYNISKHWGVELEGLGTEPDLRSDTRLGKLDEYSNITVIGAVRYRYPIGDGRFVPWFLAGIGWSVNDINDTTNSRIKTSGDGSTIAGDVGLGFDYFLADDLAVGSSVQGLIYPSIDTEVLNKDTGHVARGSANMSTAAFMVHLRMYFGQQESADGARPRTYFLADHGPYDTAERRYYLFFVAGDQIFFSDKFAPDTTARAPGSCNWMLGGGGGMNFDDHWGAEIQLINTDINIDSGDFRKIGEMSNFTVLPTARFRWQFLEGRLVPFATVGLGVSFNRPNDPRNDVDVFSGSRRTPKFEIQGSSVAASVGIGLEYFLNRHISVALALPLMIYPDVNTSVQQRSNSGALVGQAVKSSWNYTGIAPSLRLTAYLP